MSHWHFGLNDEMPLNSMSSAKGVAISIIYNVFINRCGYKYNTSQCNSAQAKPIDKDNKVDKDDKDSKEDNDEKVDNGRNNDDKL